MGPNSVAIATKAHQNTKTLGRMTTPLRRMACPFRPSFTLLVGCVCRFFPVFGPRCGQSELQTDVAFMACVLHQLLLIRQPPEHDFYAIRLRPRSGIVPGKSEKQMRVIQPLVARGEMLLPRTFLIREIRVFNDQRIALPVPPRGPYLQMHALRRTRTSIQVNHLRFQRFPTNNYRVATLNNLEGRFLTSWTSAGKRRTRRAWPLNAPAPNRPVFITSSPTIVQHLGYPRALPGSRS